MISRPTLRRTLPRRSLVTLGAALVLAVAAPACGGDEGDGGGAATLDATTTTTTTTTTTEVLATGGGADEAATATTAAPTTTTTTEATATTTAPTTTTEPPPTTTTEPEPEPVDPACLVGRWVIAEGELARFYDAITAGGAGGDVQFEVLGQLLLTFGETTYEYRPDFILQVQVAGLTGTGDVTGSITGSYTASDGIIMTSSEVNDTQLTVNVMGQTIDGTDTLNSILASAPINAAPYDCSSGTPVIDFDTGAGRIPITLTPAP